MHRRCWDLLLHTLYHKSIRTVYLLPHVLDIYLPDIILLVLVKYKKIKGYCWQVRIKIKQNRFYTYAYKTCFIFLVKIFFYGVVLETGMILPLKYLLPLRAKSATYLPISKANVPACIPGKAASNISVCEDPRARQLTLIFLSFSSSARHSVRIAKAPLLAE